MKATLSPRKLNMSRSNEVSSFQDFKQSTSKDKGEYAVLFPPGAMGLELEPVIKSSEREIGCRVKDFYFGVDYCGIEPAQLERLVTVGDIICSVDEINVRSLLFSEIVDILRSRKSNQRVLRLKNMNSTWSNEAPSVVHSSKRRERSQPPIFFNENVVNGSRMEEISPIKAPINRPSKSPKAMVSPNLQRQPLTPKQKAPRQIVNEQPPVFEIIRSPITPSAVKNLNFQGLSQSPRPKNDESFQISDPLLNEVQEVGVVIGRKAAELAFIATESISSHAQTALNQAAVVVPRYSVNEMNQVMQKKNELLSELTKSVMLLREEEEKRQHLEREVERLHDLQRENDELHEALAHKDSILEDYVLRIKSFDTEMAILKNEQRQDQLTMKANSTTVESLKNHNSELMQLIQSLQTEKKRILDENQQYKKAIEQSESKCATQEKDMSEKLSSLKDKANAAIAEKSSEIKVMVARMESMQEKWEEHHASLVSKIEELEETKKNLDAELNKSKMHGQQSISSLQELLQQRENTIQEYHTTISDLRSKIATSEITQSHLKNEVDNCNQLLLKAQTTICEQQGELQRLQNDVRDKDIVCMELKTQLTVACEDQRLSKEISASMKKEQEYLSDKTRLMDLTITAQSNEIETLQRDLTRLERVREDLEASLKDLKAKHIRDIKSSHDLVSKIRDEFNALKSAVEKESSTMSSTFVKGIDDYAQTVESFRQECLLKDNAIKSLSEVVQVSKERERILSEEVNKAIRDKENTDRQFGEEKASLETQIAALQEIKSGLESTIRELQGTIQETQENYSSLRRECATKDIDISNLRRQVSTFDQLISSVKESTLDGYRSQKEQFDTTIEIYVGQLKQTENEMKGVKRSRDEAKAEAESLRQTLSEKEKEMTHLSSMVEELKASLKLEVDEIQRSRDEWESYKRDSSADWKNKFDCLSMELESSKVRIESLTSEKTALTEKMASMAESYGLENKEMVDRIKEADEKILNLQKSLNESTMVIDNLRADIAAAKEILAEAALDREATALKHSLILQDAESRVMDVEKEKASLADEMQKLKVDHENNRKQFTVQHQDMLSTNEKLKNLCVTLSSKVVSEIRELKTFLLELKSEIACLESTQKNIFNAMETRATSLSKELEDTKMSSTSLLNQMSVQTSLVREKDSLFQRTMQLESRCVELESKLFSATHDALRATKAADERSSAFHSLKEQWELLSKESEEKTIVMADLRRQLENAEKEVECMKGEIDSLQDAVAKSTVHKVELSKRLESSESEKSDIQHLYEEEQRCRAEVDAQLLRIEEFVVHCQLVFQGELSEPYMGTDEMSVELLKLQNLILSKKNQESELNKIVHESESIISISKDQITGYQQRLQQREHQISQLEMKLKEIGDLHDIAVAEKDRLLLEVAELTNKLEQVSENYLAKEKVEIELNDALSAEKLATEKLEVDISQLKEKLESQGSFLGQQSIEFTKLEDQCHSLQSSKDLLESNLKMLQMQMKEKEEHIASLELSLTSLKKEKSDIENQSNEIMSVLDATQLTMQQKCEGLLSNILELERELHSKNNELVALQASRDDLEVKCDALNTEVFSLNEQIHLNKANICQLESEKQANLVEISVLTEKYASSDDVVRRLTVVTTSQSNEISQMREALVTNQSDLETKVSEVEKLNEHLDEAKSLLEDQSNRIESLETENKSLQSTVKDNAKVVSALREVITTLEKALHLAEDREKEHVVQSTVFEEQAKNRDLQMISLHQQLDDVKNKMLQHRAQYEQQVNAFRAENTELQSVLHETKLALDMKTTELEDLHRHISDLLQTTTSPGKYSSEEVHRPTASDNIEFDKENILGTHISPPTKKTSSSNRSPPSGGSANGSVSASVHTSPNAVEVIYTKEDQWHESLIALSLQMHESMSYLFYILYQQPGGREQQLSEEIVQLFTVVSKLQQKMHEVLARPPWVNFQDPIQSLTPAHELFTEESTAALGQNRVNQLNTLDASPPKMSETTVDTNKRNDENFLCASKGRKTEIVMCQVIVQLLLRVIRKYKVQIDDLKGGVKTTGSEMDIAPFNRRQVDANILSDDVIQSDEPHEDEDADWMRASVTSEYISERINRWMKSVESYEKSQRLADNKPADPVSSSNTNSTTTTTAAAAAVAAVTLPSRSPIAVTQQSPSRSKRLSTNMEAQDMVTAAEKWLRSPPRIVHQMLSRGNDTVTTSAVVATIDRLPSTGVNADVSLNLSVSMDVSSNSPLRFDHMLHDDSMESSDVWNISADESSLGIFEGPESAVPTGRELSFSSAVDQS